MKGKGAIRTNMQINLREKEIINNHDQNRDHRPDWIYRYTLK
jgi:hypothetical protein